MANPLVSIIVPVFNMEKYVTRCLRSIDGQAYGEIETIVVNDGSTDDSLARIEEFKSLSRFPMLVINQGNGGLGAARNAGLRHAYGTYVTFVDSDDFVSPRLCELAVKCAIETNADMVEFGYKMVDSDRAEERPGPLNGIEIVPKRKAIIGLSPMACSKLYSRELLLRAKLDFPAISHEDEAEIYRVAVFADRIVRMEKQLYYYFKRADSITGTVNSRSVDLLRVADILLDVAREHPLYYCEFVYKSISMLYRCCNTWALLKEDWAIRARETAAIRLKGMEPLERDNPYFFVAKETAQEYQNSTSWRLTRPMRAVSKLVRTAIFRGQR